jgi:hypothetical protein
MLIKPDFAAVCTALKGRYGHYERIAVEVQALGVEASLWAIRDLAIGKTRQPRYDIGAALLTLLERAHAIEERIAAHSGSG